jgi:hypothetical protein
MAMLAASVGVPYVISQGEKLGGVASSWMSKVGGDAPREDLLVDVDPSALGATPAQRILTPATVPLEGLPAFDFAEVFRMDISPEWVYQRWSRKSTALADLDRYGVRVPLVTGTLIDDLAGSLTYYFDAQGRVEHISFYGRTGDPRRLIDLVTRVYAFRPQSPDMPGEQLFQVRWNNKPTNELRIRPTGVLWANSPHASYLVELELARPGSSRVLDRGQPAVAPTAKVPGQRNES